MRKDYFVQVLADRAGVSHQDAGKVLDSLGFQIGLQSSELGDNSLFHALECSGHLARFPLSRPIAIVRLRGSFPTPSPRS